MLGGGVPEAYAGAGQPAAAKSSSSACNPRRSMPPMNVGQPTVAGWEVP